MDNYYRFSEVFFIAKEQIFLFQAFILDFMIITVTFHLISAEKEQKIQGENRRKCLEIQQKLNRRSQVDGY